MMRWESTGTEDRHESVVATPEPAGDPTLRYLLDAVLLSVSRLVSPALILAVTLSLVVAALLLGLTVDDAVAQVRWCRAC